MKEINRYIEASNVRDYVLPALQLTESSLVINKSTPKRYGKRAIHIGVDKGNGKAATLCGAHHNWDNSEWNDISIDESSDITCGSCIRSMKKLIRENNNGKPYMVIMEALGQKIENAEFHERSTGTESSPYVQGEIEPQTRFLEPVYISCKLPSGVYISIMQFTFGNDRSTHAVYKTGNITHAACGKGEHIQLDHKVIPFNEFNIITCPECALAIEKMRLGEEPHRDRTLNHRKNMYIQLKEYFDRKVTDLQDKLDRTPMSDFGKRMDIRRCMDEFNKEAIEFNENLNLIGKNLIF